MVDVFDLNLAPGTYVAAVSGGVDSMVLLDVLHNQPGVKVVVAHFDHGMRGDSAEDRALVQATARQFHLPFVYHKGELGKVGEAAARKARYDFLHQVREASGAKAIVTAHHMDDRLETALLNVTRGTGRRGLSSLKSTDTIVRPLLNVPKSTIIAYARGHGIKWREDATNSDTKYLRNYIRHRVIPKIKSDQRTELLATLSDMEKLNDEIDARLINQLHVQRSLDHLDRHHVIMLPHSVAKELVAFWLRQHGARYDSRMLELLVTAIKTLKPGRIVPIDASHNLIVANDEVFLATRKSGSRNPSSV